jgi:hypothetical protein
MKTNKTVDVSIHVFLTSVLDRGEKSASHPGCFTPSERTTGTHCVGGWVGLRADLDDVEKRNICFSTNVIDQECVQNFDLNFLNGFT